MLSEISEVISEGWYKRVFGNFLANFGEFFF
jgi:hypothetical protein